MAIRIALVEDELKYRDSISEFLKTFADKKNIEIKLSQFQDGDEIATSYSCDYDIILMDIMMQFMDGMKAAEEIRKKDNNVIIIFITNMTNYAIKGYQVGAFDYILKPLTYFAFKKSLERALEKLDISDTEEYISVSIPNGVQKIRCKNIRYIESDAHYLNIHLEGEELRTYMRIGDAEKALKSFGFFRINKGILVNLKHVDGVADNCCIILETNLPISRGKKKEFMERLTEYMNSH